MSQADALLTSLVSGEVSTYSTTNNTESFMLLDPSSGTKYKLYVVNGALSMEGTTGSTSNNELVLKDSSTGYYWKLHVVDGKLTMTGTTNPNDGKDHSQLMLLDSSTGKYYKLYVVNSALTMSETTKPDDSGTEEPEVPDIPVDRNAHIVIDDERYITVPIGLHKIAVQHDHDIETVTFDCPRYWDGHDLSVMKVYINYMRPDTEVGRYLCPLVTVDESNPDIMHFNWTISGHVTEAKGTLSFLVCAMEADANGDEVRHWNSELNTEMYISTGLEPTQAITKKYPDIITQLLTKMERLEQCEVAVTGEQILNLQMRIVNNENALSIYQLANSEKISELETADADLATRVKALEDKKISSIDGNLTVTGTLTANKVVGAVYA